MFLGSACDLLGDTGASRGNDQFNIIGIVRSQVRQLGFQQVGIGDDGSSDAGDKTAHTLLNLIAEHEAS
jgi:hypothetical protein